MHILSTVGNRTIAGMMAEHAQRHPEREIQGARCNRVCRRTASNFRRQNSKAPVAHSWFFLLK